MIQSRPATLADVEFFVANLREEDRVEYRAAYGVGNERSVLQQTIEQTYDCQVAEVDGVPFAIFGIGPGPEGSAIPWLIGTDVLTDNRQFLCRIFPRVLAGWKAKHPLMFNCVLATHTKTIRWLQWLGFTIADPIPYGDEQRLFHPFFQVNAQCAGSHSAL